MIWYVKKNRKMLLVFLLLFLAFNFYFLLLMSDVQLFFLLYVDLLLLLSFAMFFCWDCHKESKRHTHLQELLDCKDLIYQELPSFEHMDVILHEVQILKNQVDTQFDLNCDLQDYITKWCHEVKVPLAALFLMIENLEDEHQKKMMKEQLEKMRQQLNNALLGCRVQSSIYDFQIKKVPLMECVKSAVKNNQFFLIHHHFALALNVSEVSVYTDKEWLIYAIDQVIANAIKYCSEAPGLKIWVEEKDKKIYLYLEDDGMGIKEQDLRYVFDKGFTGSNLHNGKYKSTGMGLYLVNIIMKKLGHAINVESKFGSYTRITFMFQDSRDYFNL